MAVWERFFENAAVACGGESGSARAPSAFPIDQQVHDSEDRQHRSRGSSRRVSNVVKDARSGEYGVSQLTNGHHQAVAEKLEEDSSRQVSDQPTRAQVLHEESGVVVTNEMVGDGTTPNETSDNSGSGERGWSQGGANCRNLGGRMDLQLSRLPPDSQVGVRTPRFCAWEPKPIDPVLDQEGDDFDRVPFQELTPRHWTEGEQLVRLGSAPPLFSQKGIDLHLFHTPRGGDDAEALWLPKSREGDLPCTLESPPSGIKGPGAEENPAYTGFNYHQAWVACWDDASESIYYWNSDSEQLTWAEPAPITALAEGDEPDRFPTRVWDPKQEAFFTIDEGGVSHWLVKPRSSPALTTPLVESRAVGDGTGSPINFSIPPTVCDRADVSSERWKTCAEWQQGLGAVAAAVERLPLNDASSFRDTLSAVGDGEREGSTTSALLSAEVEPDGQGERLTPSSVPNADCRTDVHGFYDPEEQCYSGFSSLVYHPGAGQEYEVEQIDDCAYENGSAVGEERPSSMHTAGASAKSAVENGNAEEEKADGLEFFDTKTCDDYPQSKDNSEKHEQSGRRASSTTITTAPPLLSAWVLWCTLRSRDNDGTPSYFVNEETCTSSWVLPPGAVVESKGWLRAWSEGHQAWFYANHWTGRVTWELQDLEAER